MIGLIETITDRGAPVLARNTLAAVRKMFNWAVSRDLLDRSPCDRVKAPGKAPKRERVLGNVGKLEGKLNDSGKIFTSLCCHSHGSGLNKRCKRTGWIQKHRQASP
ncbi:MAG: hypothetical protein ACREYF_21005 [Gammaproteobacteria bacterium]